MTPAERQKLLAAKITTFFRDNPEEELLAGDVLIKWGADQSTVANVLAILASQNLIKVRRDGYEWTVSAA